MKIIKLILIGVFLFILTGCTPQLPKIFKEKSYSVYKTYKQNKALAYAKSNTSGYYVAAYCKDKKTEQEAIECAVNKCNNVIESYMQIKESSCKVYDLNDEVVWK